MPMNRKEYPDNWELLRARALDRSGHLCSLCAAPDGAIIYRRKDGRLNPAQPYLIPVEYNSIKEHIAHKYRKTKVILTTHHINSDKTDNSDHNLIALCQRCHLKLDMAKHIKNRAKRGIK